MKLSLEQHFQRFAKNIIGQNSSFQSPNGVQPIVYADWIASGRLYGPIEDKMLNEIEKNVLFFKIISKKE
jgi:hypothetical protein